jgi:hypothetical protein
MREAETAGLRKRSEECGSLQLLDHGDRRERSSRVVRLFQVMSLLQTLPRSSAQRQAIRNFSRPCTEKFRLRGLRGGAARVRRSFPQHARCVYLPDLVATQPK